MGYETRIVPLVFHKGETGLSYENETLAGDKKTTSYTYLGSFTIGNFASFSAVRLGKPNSSVTVPRMRFYNPSQPFL